MKTKYMLLALPDARGLQTEVNIWLRKGWELQGGAGAAISNSGSVFTQAMVKFESTTTHLGPG